MQLHRRRRRWDPRFLTPKLPMPACCLQLAIAFGEDLRLASLQFGQRSDVADSAVKPDLVVVPHVALDEPPRVVQRRRGTRPDPLGL